jgi:hypothetical protein
MDIIAALVWRVIFMRIFGCWRNQMPQSGILTPRTD